MATKILFTFTAQDVNVAKTQDDVKDRLAAINKEIKAAKAAGSPYGALIGESIKLKRESVALREEQAKLNKEFKATTVPKDSLAGLRLEYSKLTDAVNKLSAAERASPAGQSIIKNASNVKGQIDGIEQSLGRFTGNVGNYKSALLGIGDALTGGLATGGIAAGVGVLIKLFQAGTAAALTYEKQLDDLSALTGKVGADLQGLQDVEQGLRDINVEGVKIVSTGSTILTALKDVGGARPELLEDSKALGEVAKNAIILSKAGGDTLKSSVESLTTVLGQFNLEGYDSSRIINELAAGAKVGASEIPQTTAALREFGTVAKISNVSTGESIALIELLAANQLKGAEAGTQLRNILTKLAAADVLPKKALDAFKRLGIDINVLRDATLPLEVRLKELAKAQGDLGALSKAFGVENLQAAAIITSSIPKYQELQKGIEGTNEAYKQAAIRADNASQSIDNLSAKVSNKLQTAFQGATPIIKTLTDQLGNLIDQDLSFGGLFLTAITAPFDRGKQPVKTNPNSTPFNVNDPFSGALGEVKDPFGVLRPLTEKEKIAAQQRAIELTKIKAEAEKEEEKKQKGTTKESFAAGSLGALQKEFEALQKKINNTPGDSPLLAGLLKDSEAVSQKITTLKNVISELRNPSRELTDDERALELATGINSEAAIKEAKRLRDKLGAELGGIAPGETFSPEDETLGKLNREQADNDNASLQLKLDNEKSVQEALKEAAIQSAQNIANAVFDIQKNALQKEQDAKLAALNDQEAKAIEAAGGNAAKEKAIRADFEKKRVALEKEGARQRKAIAIKEALINTALAITKAFTLLPPFSYIAAGIAAISGAAQLATINAQEFAGGGKVKRLGTGVVNEKQNAPRTVNGDTVLAYLKPGEMVLNQSQQSNIAGMAGSDVFQKAGVPGVSRSKPVPFFASGGVVDFIPQTSFAQSQNGSVSLNAQASFTPDQIQQIGSSLGIVIANAVAAEVKKGIGEGLGDANRRLEREEDLQTQRQG